MSLLYSRNLSKEGLEKNCRQIHGDKYAYLDFFHKGKYRYIKAICKIHGEFIQRYSHHIGNHGCSKCSGNKKITHEEFVNRSNELHNFEYEYLSKYCGTHKKILIKHKKCGNEFYQEAKSHSIEGQGCPKCKKKSLGEEKIKSFLIEKKINFEIEKTFEDCKDVYRLRFDFYIPEKNLLIEYDGKQHFTSRNIWGGKKALIAVKKRDEIKNNYAKQKGINLLRLNHKQFYNLEECLMEVLL